MPLIVLTRPTSIEAKLPHWKRDILQSAYGLETDCILERYRGLDRMPWQFLGECACRDESAFKLQTSLYQNGTMSVAPFYCPVLEAHEIEHFVNFVDLISEEICLIDIARQFEIEFYGVDLISASAGSLVSPWVPLEYPHPLRKHMRLNEWGLFNDVSEALEFKQAYLRNQGQLNLEPSEAGDMHFVFIHPYDLAR
jgi:hypothetical protein